MERSTPKTETPLTASSPASDAGENNTAITKNKNLSPLFKRKLSTAELATLPEWVQQEYKSMLAYEDARDKQPKLVNDLITLFDKVQKESKQLKGARPNTIHLMKYLNITIEQAQLSYNSIVSLINTCGESKVTGVITLLIHNLNNYLNVSKDMNEEQMFETAYDIMHDFPQLRLEEIIYALQKAKKQGNVFDHIDGQIIYGWVNDYWSAKIDSLNKQHEITKGSSDYSMETFLKNNKVATPQSFEKVMVYVNEIMNKNNALKGFGETNKEKKRKAKNLFIVK